MKPVRERKGKQGGKHCILAFGESTGHTHKFENEDTAVLEGTTLTIKTKDNLIHEEHNSHVIEPGIGEVTIQREYQMGRIRRVLD